jgi:hypothetical protein
MGKSAGRALTVVIIAAGASLGKGLAFHAFCGYIPSFGIPVTRIIHGPHRNPKRKRGRHKDFALAYASGYDCALCNGFPGAMNNPG